MNEKERRFTAITLSLFAHFIFLQGTWAFDREASSSSMQTLVLDFSQSSQAPTETDGALALHQGMEDDENRDMRNRQRAIKQLFLEQIQSEIHGNRLTLGNTDLIGVVWYSFRINTIGIFDEINIEKSSGNSQLDADAYQAIIRASGKIKRPSSLGKENFSIMIPIKYQYSLY